MTDTRMSGHVIVWEFDGDTVAARVECRAPEGADCRLHGGPGCDCEAWMIRRDPDGTAYHLAADDWYLPEGEESARHPMVSGECNVELFLNDDPYLIPELCHDRRALFTIGETRIEPVWTGDSYDWRPADS